MEEPSSGVPATPASDAVPEGLYDIVVPTPETPVWPLLLWILLSLAVLVGIALLARRLLRSGRGRGPTLTPAELARRSFDRAERESPAPNRYALLLSEAVKDYLASRFRDPVRYETSEEFLARASREGTHLPPTAQASLLEFLAAAEEVKFGRPGDAETRLQALSRRARELVALCESISSPGGHPN